MAVTVFWLVCVGSTTAVSSTPNRMVEEPAGEGSVAEAVANARSIRATFHLDASDEAIGASENTVERLGVAVTVGEAARIDRQLTLEHELDDTRGAIIAGVGEGFAGTWVDRDTDGITVATAGDPDVARAAAEAASPGVEVTVEVVERSQEELRDLTAQVSREVGGDLGVVSIARRPKDNVVVAGVEEGRDLDHAGRELTARYGEGVTVQPISVDLLSRTSGPSSNPAKTWQAGKQIGRVPSDPDSFCSGAFGVKRGVSHYVLTAAHCEDYQVFPSTWKVGTQTLGVTTEFHGANPPVMFTDADVAMVKVTTSGWVSTNCVYLTSTSCPMVNEYEDPEVGDTVCYSGARTGDLPGNINCGEVVVERVVHYIHPNLFDMLEYESADGTGACRGDSGGPIYSIIPGEGGQPDKLIGRGILSYRVVDGFCTGPDAKRGDTGFSRWSNIQGRLGIEGGCNGSWVNSSGCPAGAFTDVKYQHRFHDEIKWASTTQVNGSYITTGFTDGTFRPTDPVTRQTAVTWLWRLNGSPTGYTDPLFTDVPTNHTFYNAIAWAAATGITNGYTSGCATGNPCFKPTDPIGRKGWAVFLYREAGEPYSGLSLGAVPIPPYGLCDVTTTNTGAEEYKAIMWNVVQRVTRPRTNYQEGCLAQHFDPIVTLDRQTAMASMYNFEHL